MTNGSEQAISSSFFRIIITWKQLMDIFFLRIIPLKITPNILTFSRIPVGACALLAYAHESYWIASAAFLLGSLTDYLDGLVARARDLTSDFGQVLDERTDKVFVNGAALFIAVGLWDQFKYSMAALVFCGVLTILRDLYMVWARKAKRVQITSVLPQAKLKTGMQMVAIGLLLFAGVAEVGVYSAVGLFILATGLALQSAWRYTRGF